MLKIYGFETFNALKVVLTAECLEIPYQYVYLDPSKGEHKSEENLKRHPMGKVPVIEWDDKVLFESDAICRYLGNRTERLYGETIWERALIDQTIDMVAFHQGRWLSSFFFEEVVKPKFGKEEKDPAKLEEATKWLSQQMPILEKQLEKSGYLVGEGLSIADIVAWSYCTITLNTSYPLENHPILYKWFLKLQEMEPFKRGMDVVYRKAR